MITVILCAAGKGERAGFLDNKVLRERNGLPVLCHSLSAFSPFADEILIACRKEDRARVDALLAPYPCARTVIGGETRAQSVYAALKEAKDGIVLVHDAARPFVSHRIIRDCIESVKKYGSGVCALPAVDTTVIAKDGVIERVPARDSVFTVQTPQGFYRDELLAAYERAFTQKREFTDDSGVYAEYIRPPRLFIGERENKKLTYPEDFAPAERAGFGADTHAFFSDGEGAPLIGFITLCGVKIPSSRPLKAHSDGDVAVHALMDALLSAAGLRDIGYYFPDTDEKYAGADSTELLKEVVRLIADEGFSPRNVSISILAETPRLAPYIERMKENLAYVLGISPSAIGIAAGTNEKLGYVGEGKGITCFAMVMLNEKAEG